MKSPIARSERGQSVVIVALLLVALMGMLALAIDGGNAFFKRRESQNAADAGALAGAHEWCNTRNAASAASRANEYAITRNGATKADVTVNNGIVTVSTTITVATTFGAVLGVRQLNAGGYAVAGCFFPGSGTGVLPIAWACPIDPISYKCALVYNYTMVVMDSEKTATNIVCQDPPHSGKPAGALNCDVNNDGINDVIVGGNRSWLDLDGGGGGAASLKCWVNGGCPTTVNYHTWYGGQTGTTADVFQTVANHVGQTFVVPIFNKYCNQQGLPQNVCPGLWDAQDTVVVSGGTSVLYYHVITFAMFHVTCVDYGGHAVAEPGIKIVGNKCPKELALDNAGFYTKPSSLKSIEGYFVQGAPGGVSGRPGDGMDAGAYTVYLTQ